MSFPIYHNIKYFYLIEILQSNWQICWGNLCCVCTHAVHSQVSLQNVVYKELLWSYAVSYCITHIINVQPSKSPAAISPNCINLERYWWLTPSWTWSAKGSVFICLVILMFTDTSQDVQRGRKWCISFHNIFSSIPLSLTNCLNQP